MSVLNYIDEDFAKSIADAPPLFADLRNAGLEAFSRLGFPTRKLEAWKYTDLSPLTKLEFRLPQAADVNEELVASLLPASSDGGLRMVFADGCYLPHLSSTGSSGITLATLAEAVFDDPKTVRETLGQSINLDQEAFSALNTAFLGDGVFLRIHASAEISTPIHCVFVSTGTQQASASHPRILIVAEAASQARVIETYLGPDGASPYFCNTTTEVFLAENAALDHCRVQRESTSAYHVSSLVAQQSRYSRFASRVVSLGAAISRSDTTALLKEEGAECVFDGLYVVAGDQHVDHHTSIDHIAPRCSSHELYKGTLDGRSSGVFNGRVFVREDAQKSDAQQMNNNLLLSDTASIDTKPQLEIFADDVKCSHGATVGQLDDDAVFYLRSRGISVEDARALLTYGFANEVIQRLPDEALREELEALLASQLHRDEK